MTGEKSGGIKGERALPVQLSRDSLSYKDNYSGMGLYCVPLSHKYNINKSSNTHVAFFSLDDVHNGNSKFTCTQSTLTLLFILKKWLAEKHMQDGSIQCMFRIRAEYRISVCINNPVFIPRSKEQTSIDGRNTANFDALTKMLAIEKCDTVVMNPLFGSGLPYNAKTNIMVSNIYWGRGVPDYAKIISYHQASMESKRGMDPVWARNYPIHKCAYEGDVAGITARLSQFSHSMKDDKSASPIHYAAWKGHTEAVVALLKAGCSPNITNKDLQTPLHIAAIRGHPQVVNVLLEDSDIDVNPQDKNKKTPHDLCSKETRPEFLKAANLLSVAMNRPSQKIEIHLMDGGKKTLNLTAGDNTTVNHFKEQMLRNLMVYSFTHTSLPICMDTCSSFALIIGIACGCHHSYLNTALYGTDSTTCPVSILHISVCRNSLQLKLRVFFLVFHFQHLSNW
ncbi:KRIT1 [Acanthosepion pharaonis]|uniref:KRIT1 n=1 Tax=Acanthosepion pharaonis TaxID=158019 RepID=A0A812DT74_ACAPH|nr:KRIT1 [Sepia pharaonis]